MSSNKQLHGTRDYYINWIRIPEVRDRFVQMLYIVSPSCDVCGIRYNPINSYTQSMLVTLSGSRDLTDLHWLIGMLVFQCTHKQALSVASDLGQT